MGKYGGAPAAWNGARDYHLPCGPLALAHHVAPLQVGEVGEHIPVLVVVLAVDAYNLVDERQRDGQRRLAPVCTWRGAGPRLSGGGAAGQGAESALEGNPPYGALLRPQRSRGRPADHAVLRFEPPTMQCCGSSRRPCSVAVRAAGAHGAAYS
eukprot:832514-Prymnesium_polylepis.1